MKTLTHSITRTLAAALLAAVAAAPLFADGAVKFRPATAADPVVGRYLVTIATADAATDATTADVLARSYGGRIEPYAVEGFRGFMIVMAPTRARALSADPRVAVVEEQAGREEDAVFAVPEPPRPAVTAPPAPRAEAVRQPRTDWEQEPALWKSGDITYDGAGNVKSIGTDLYRYDGAGRLTYATARTAPSPANAQQFEYDRYGNLQRITTTTTAGTEVTRYALDAAQNNRLGTVCPAGETYNDCVTGVYDAVGNQTGITTAGEFVWDPLGMMKERHGVGVQRYLYDANDERIATLHYVAGLEARRTYTLRGSDNKVAREVSYDSATAEWKLIRDYVYRSGTLIAAFGSTGNTPAVHYHVDHLGSTRLVTDGAGYQSAFHTYWPFGEEAPGSDLDAERLKFTGHERDSFGDGSLDLDYMHARFYNPGAGRFLSIDPTWASADLGTPQSWNRYTYVQNDPINRIDPDGRIGFGVLAKVIKVAIKGGDVASTVSGMIDDVQTLRSENASRAAKALAAASLLSEVLSPISLKDVKALKKLADRLPDDALVVRGGLNTPDNFVNGTGVSVVDGKLQNVSVNSAPGATVSDLSEGIPNGQVGVTTVGDVRAAGGDVVPDGNPRNCNHCTLNGLTPEKASELMTPTQPNPQKKRRDDVDR